MSRTALNFVSTVTRASPSVVSVIDSSDSAEPLAVGCGLLPASSELPDRELRCGQSDETVVGVGEQAVRRSTVSALARASNLRGRIGIGIRGWRCVVVRIARGCRRWRSVRRVVGAGTAGSQSGHGDTRVTEELPSSARGRRIRAMRG
jgi:hypothetical protein